MIFEIRERQKTDRQTDRQTDTDVHRNTSQNRVPTAWTVAQSIAPRAYIVRMVYRVYDCSPPQRRDSIGATENAGFNATVPRADLGGD